MTYALICTECSTVLQEDIDPDEYEEFLSTSICSACGAFDSVTVESDEGWEHAGA